MLYDLSSSEKRFISQQARGLVSEQERAECKAAEKTQPVITVHQDKMRDTDSTGVQDLVTGQSNWTHPNEWFVI